MKSARCVRSWSWLPWWKRLTVASLIIRFIRSNWPLVHGWFGLVTYKERRSAALTEWKSLVS